MVTYIISQSIYRFSFLFILNLIWNGTDLVSSLCWIVSVSGPAYNSDFWSDLVLSALDCEQKPTLVSLVPPTTPRSSRGHHPSHRPSRGHRPSHRHRPSQCHRPSPRRRPSSHSWGSSGQLRGQGPRQRFPPTDFPWQTANGCKVVNVDPRGVVTVSLGLESGILLI